MRPISIIWLCFLCLSLVDPFCWGTWGHDVQWNILALCRSFWKSWDMNSLVKVDFRNGILVQGYFQLLDWRSKSLQIIGTTFHHIKPLKFAIIIHDIGVGPHMSVYTSWWYVMLLFRVNGKELRTIYPFWQEEQIWFTWSLFKEIVDPKVWEIIGNTWWPRRWCRNLLEGVTKTCSKEPFCLPTKGNRVHL